ncbi:hypothetical protein GUI12_02995 [Anaplasmataceae bacterium AB001_6]|nr:hypothetical protein GUI12_02995 [Anaplasmataceae bacterium AB001_6]
MNDKKFLQEIIKLAFNITNNAAGYESIIVDFIDLITAKHSENYSLYHIFSKKNDVIKDILFFSIINLTKLCDVNKIEHDNKSYHKLLNVMDSLYICDLHLSDKITNNTLDLKKISIKVDKIVEDRLSSSVINIPSSDNLGEV